jgi:hypothetical protein
MRSIKQAVVALAAGGLLVAGGTFAGISLTQGTARADNVDACLASTGTGSQCQVDDQTVPDPSDIYLQLESPSGAKELNANLTWSVSCPSTATATSGSQSAEIPSIVYIAQGVSLSSSESCTVTATMAITNFSGNTENAQMLLNYDEGTGTSSSPTPAPSATSSVPSGGVTGYIKGYDGKCVNDKSNSSSNGAQVTSWGCDKAKQQSWRYASGELIHNGKCLNDKGNGGSGSKVILYTCGAANGKWTELANGELKLQSHGGQLCLDDPAYSTKNGTQMIVYTCKDSANQKWSLP